MESINFLLPEITLIVLSIALLANSIFDLGFGFIEVGTVTPLKQYGNPKPRIFRLIEDQALINRLGFNNLGAENISSRIRFNRPKGLLGVNLGPNKDTQNRLEALDINSNFAY